MAGLILGGSLLRGEAWALSDIDLIPVYEDATADVARREVELRRDALWNRWKGDGGWPPPLDTSFSLLGSAVCRVLDAPDAAAAALMTDATWYDAVDKRADGRVVVDPHGLVTPFVAWCTRQRGRPSVVEARRRYAWGEARRWEQSAWTCLATRDGVGDLERVAATHAVWRGSRVDQRRAPGDMGERNRSSRRWETRFAQLARDHGHPELASCSMR